MMHSQKTIIFLGIITNVHTHDAEISSFGTSSNYINHHVAMHCMIIHTNAPYPTRDIIKNMMRSDKTNLIC